MAQMTPEVSKLLEQALSLCVQEQEALADSLISNLGGQVCEGVQAAWEAEIGKRIAELESGKAQTTSWAEVHQAQFGEAASCPAVLRSFMMKPPPNMMRHSIGTWPAAPMPHSSSTP